MNAQLYDPYGAYPLNLGAAGLQLADEDFWPSSGSLEFSAGDCQVTIMPATELAVPPLRTVPRELGGWAQNLHQARRLGVTDCPPGSLRHSAATDLDACPVRRDDLTLRVDPQTNVVSEIARWRDSIDREAAAVEKTLNDHRSTSEDDYPRWGWAEHKELSRQLAALHECVARARSRSQDQLALRAEFATLLSFAKTLRTDAETWRAAFEGGLRELELQETATRQERERLAAEREALMRRRDALQFTIDEAAERVAQENGGDCRRTIPVFRLGEAVTVCSVSVLSPRKGFRSQKCWLVTLNHSRDQVRVTRR